jgi:hypothetical protein
VDINIPCTSATGSVNTIILHHFHPEHFKRSVFPSFAPLPNILRLKMFNHINNELYKYVCLCISVHLIMLHFYHVHPHQS